MSASGRVDLSLVRFDSDAWPRTTLDTERVGEFEQLFRVEGVDVLPPIELFADGAGGFLIADGVHRREAARRAGVRELPAVVLPATSVDPVAAAYRHALHRSAISAKPLTRPEKRLAIRRLLREQPQSSDREIGRLVGVDHKTVGRLRKQLEVPGLLGDGEQGERVRWPSPAGAAKKLFKAFEKAYEARGLGVVDFFTGDRTGERLANVLADVYGMGALERARTFLGWLEHAVSALEAGELEAGEED